ncbi:unnamed protein product [Taenia asiatica]|uniref:Ysc84 domain-containing protein n=1 Tax=Taenia asiatica TaxID=60517 RepID=A0A0R3WGR8_TAEAS|nr:unnamed protein product [Taenia asiatica]
MQSLPTLICMFLLLALSSQPAFTAIMPDEEAVLKLKTGLYEGREEAMNAVGKEAFKESDENDKNESVVVVGLKSGVSLAAETGTNHAFHFQGILLVLVEDRLLLSDLSSAAYKAPEPISFKFNINMMLMQARRLEVGMPPPIHLAAIIN